MGSNKHDSHNGICWPTVVILTVAEVMVFFMALILPEPYREKINNWTLFIIAIVIIIIGIVV